MLNPSGVQSTGAVVAEIEDTRGWKPGRFRKGDPLSWDEDTAWNLAPNACLQVANCDRSIRFAFDWETASDRRAALLKVDRLVGALSAFRDALADEQRLYVERMAEARRAGPPKKEASDGEVSGG